MKTNWTQLVCALLLVSLNACKNGSKEPATPAKQCRLTSVTQRDVGTNSNGTITTEYQYDVAGNVVQIIYKQLGGSGASSTSQTTDVALTYDAGGYLKKTVQQGSYRSSGSAETSSTQTYEYAYTADRLIKTVNTYRGNNYGSAYNGIETISYEYDAAGKPLKVTIDRRDSNPLNNSKQINTYVNGVLTGIITQYDGGLASSNGTEYNAQGYAKVRVLSPYTNRYEYDTKSRLVRQENYENDILRGYSDYTWDDRPSAYTTLPKLKGHPQGPNFYSFDQYSFTPPHRRTEGAHYEYTQLRIRQGTLSNRTGQFYPITDWVRTPVYGTNGLPELMTYVFDSSREDDQGKIVTTRYTGETRFTYENCP